MVCRNLGLETRVFQLRATAFSEFAAEAPPQVDRGPSSEIPTTLSVVADPRK